MPVKGLERAGGRRRRPVAAASPAAASGTSRRTCGRSTATPLQGTVQRALLRRRQPRQRARPRSGRRWTRSRATPTRCGRRQRGADRVPARAAADHDPLHEPAERDPAGDLLRPPPAPLARGRLLPGYGRTCVTTPKTTQVAAGVSAAVLAHAALDDRVLARALDVEHERVRAADAQRRRRSGWRRRVSAPSPLPTRRATLTGWPDWLMNVTIEIGSSLPAAAFWSLQVAVSVPRPLMTRDGLRRAGRVVGDLEDAAERLRLARRRRRTCPGMPALVGAGAVGGDELAGGRARASSRRRRRSCRRPNPRARHSSRPRRTCRPATRTARCRRPPWTVTVGRSSWLAPLVRIDRLTQIPVPRNPPWLTRRSPSA